MTTPLLPNKWHLRRVAPTASKPCHICYKSTSAVLITPCNKDFFYVCVGHLSDRGFATPDQDAAAEVKARREKEALERERERVVREYEVKREVRRKKKEKKDGEKEKEKEKKKDDEDDKAQKEEDEEKANEERDIKALDKEADEKEKESEEVRVYVLSRTFYQQRIDRIRNAQQAKRDRERLRNPATFPSVPSALPGAPGAGP